MFWTFDKEKDKIVSFMGRLGSIIDVCYLYLAHSDDDFLSSNKSTAFELSPLAPGALCSFISFQRSPTPSAGRPAIQGGGWPPIRPGDPALLLHPLGSCTALPLLPLRCSPRVCMAMIDSVAPFGQRTKWKPSAMMEDAGTLRQVLKAAPEMMQSSSFWARSPRADLCS